MRLRKCQRCGYTMQEVCRCGARARSAHPPKFSERYAVYRRMAKLSLKKKA